MEKILPILVVGIFILSTFCANATLFYDNETELQWEQIDKISVTTRDDELDQSQPDMDWFAPIGVFPLVPGVNYMVAQSFKPTLNILTRVELMAGRNGTTTYDYIVVIRDDLLGADLTSVSLPPSSFVVENFSWVEFDFDDIEVTPGKTYYIVSYTTNTTDNWYVWGAKINDAYPDGTPWVSTDDGETWEEELDADMTFKTYGIDNLPPDAPIIGGQTSGKAGKEYEYTFNATDPDGDPVMYYIDWGDNNTDWTEYGDSGEEISLKHTWMQQGTYTIRAKAKDINGVEGPEGTLDVSMPKNKPKPNNDFTPLPHFGLSIVFYRGDAEVYDYTESYPSITLRPQHHEIKWFCFRKPWFSSTSHGFVTNIHDYRGIVKPEPIVPGGNIKFLFVVAKDIIVMLP